VLTREMRDWEALPTQCPSWVAPCLCTSVVHRRCLETAALVQHSHAHRVSTAAAAAAAAAAASTAAAGVGTAGAAAAGDAAVDAGVLCCRPSVV
jgi:hypothetical protein